KRYALSAIHSDGSISSGLESHHIACHGRLELLRLHKVSLLRSEPLPRVKVHYEGCCRFHIAPLLPVTEHATDIVKLDCVAVLGNHLTSEALVRDRHSAERACVFRQKFDRSQFGASTTSE